MREPREYELKPIPANEARARVMGGFMIRESLMKKWIAAHKTGLAFPDSAQAAGIPYEYALAALSHDDDVRKMYREAQGRKSLIRAEDADLIPDTKSTMEIKRDIVNLAMAGGIGNKFAETIAHLKPIDEGGNLNHEHVNVLNAFMKHITSMLPKESENKNQDQEPEEKEQLSEAQAMKLLMEAREARLKKEAAEEKAIEARASGGRSLKGPKLDGRTG